MRRRLVIAGRARRVGVRLSEPLLLSQLFSSLAGAGAVFLVASRIDKSEFAAFAFMNLVLVTLIGAQRCLILLPALTFLRQDARSFVSAGTASVCFLFGAVIFAAASGIGTSVGFAGAILLAGSALAGLAQDWLRYRLISADKRWFVAVSDAIRVGGLVLLVVVPVMTASEAQLFVGAGYAAALVPLLVAFRRAEEVVPFRRYRAQALAQFLDFVMSTANGTLPLLVLGPLGAQGTVAAFRFAQALFGPMNLVFSAAESTFLADGVKRIGNSQDLQLIGSGWRVSNALAIAAACVLGGVVFVLVVVRPDFRGLELSALLAAVVVVGLTAVLSGWVGFQNIVMRILGFSGSVAVSRIYLTVVGTVTYFVLVIVWGPVVAIIVGGAVTALLYPVFFLPPAFRRYARVRSTDPV